MQFQLKKLEFNNFIKLHLRNLSTQVVPIKQMHAQIQE